jgi:hypothetical protein
MRRGVLAPSDTPGHLPGETPRLGHIIFDRSAINGIPSSGGTSPMPATGDRPDSPILIPSDPPQPATAAYTMPPLVSGHLSAASAPPGLGGGTATSPPGRQRADRPVPPAGGGPEHTFSDHQRPGNRWDRWRCTTPARGSNRRSAGPRQRRLAGRRRHPAEDAALPKTSERDHRWLQRLSRFPLSLIRRSMCLRQASLGKEDGM